jgi:hypothetical protein
MIERFQYIGREDIMNIFDKNTNILENECELEIFKGVNV